MGISKQVSAMLAGLHGVTVRDGNSGEMLDGSQTTEHPTARTRTSTMK